MAARQPEMARAGDAGGIEGATLLARVVLALTPRSPRRVLTAVRYASAPAATLAVALVQYALLPEPAIAPFVLFYFGIALVGCLAGRGPGLVTVLISGQLANYAFVPPYVRWSLSGPALTATALFALSGIPIALLCGSLRSSLLRTQRIAGELRRQGELLRLSHDAILVSRRPGAIEFWNRGAEQLYGFSAEEARGRVPEQLLQTRFPRPQEEIEAELRERGRWEGELTHRAKDGRTLTVSAKLQRVRGEDGIERVLESNRDITDRKRDEAALRASEEKLRESDVRKNEFLGVLSHELRNPLAPIRNSLYILGRAEPGGEQARRSLAVIERQVHQLARLTDDLLDVTRISRGKVRLQRERTDLGAVVRRTAEDHRALFVNDGLELEVIAGDDPVYVSADPTRIGQVIGNLLQNAAKFTPPGGRTTLSLDTTDGRAVITVRDTGMGIAPDVLQRLFEPFVQADNTLDRSTGGLGLGLALVKGLVELHGGSVSAFSAGVGKGATFTVELLLERRRTSRLSAVPAPLAGGPRRVLLIEDNVDAALSMKEALEMSHHVVDVAYSGPEGVEKARAFHPDVILCDIGLPIMNGFQVARALRADPELRSIALIALSGYAQAEDLERSREAGFDLHLAKPVDVDMLQRMMSQVSARAAAG